MTEESKGDGTGLLRRNDCCRKSYKLEICRRPVFHKKQEELSSAVRIGHNFVTRSFHAGRVTLWGDAVRWHVRDARYYFALLRQRSIAIRLSVCLCANISLQLLDRSSPFFVHIPCGRGSALLWRRCDTLCTSGFWMTS